MNTAVRYTFSRDEKLKSRKVVELLFKEGKAFSVFPLRVVYRLTDVKVVSESTNQSYVQAGFSVSSKNFKRAVDRNRIKRLMRETYRLQKNELMVAANQSSKTLSVFFIYTGNELPLYDFIFEKMGKSIKRLQKIINENSNDHT